MRGVEERLIGFDVREAWTETDQRWDAPRRARFLLRADARRPLSTDTLVWPSVFDSGQGIGLPAEQRAQLGLAGIPLPGWTGPNVGLWNDRAAMRQLLSSHAPRVPFEHCTELAITWLSASGFLSGDVGPYLEPTEPPTLSSDWRFLGFDVADGSLTSGLTNCGYTDSELSHLSNTWGPLLNEHHLFADLEHAWSFREIADRRVPEHAPFYVFGLWVPRR
jgi:hypothetical protein